MVINDRYSAHGYVTIYDANGKSLTENHNMIVLFGRKLIRDALFASTGNTDISPAKFRLYLEHDTSVTTTQDTTKATDTIKDHLTATTDATFASNTDLQDKSLDDIISFYKNSTNSATIKSVLYHYHTSSADPYPYVSITYKYAPNENIKVTACDLLYDTADVFSLDNDSCNIFSRATFEPILLRSGRSYLICYNIYF